MEFDQKKYLFLFLAQNISDTSRICSQKHKNLLKTSTLFVNFSVQRVHKKICHIFIFIF